MLSSLFSDLLQRLSAVPSLETASMSSTRSLASVWSLSEPKAPLGSLGTKLETTADQPELVSPTRWQVAFALTVALALLLRWIHHQVRAATQGKPTTASPASTLKPEDSLLLMPDIDDEDQPPRVADASRRKQSRRFVALDVLRGATICLMVFVNYGGGGMAAFTHSVWDGLTVADVLFPWFAWIMGFSVFLASNAAPKRRARLRSIAARSVRLLLLGLFLNNGSSWRHWRVPGVLQALAVGYLVVALADLTLSPSTSNISTNIRVQTILTRHLAMVVAPLIAVNVAITFALPVPGCPTGYIGPGGNSAASEGTASLANCTGGAHWLADLTVFGRDHLFQTPTCQQTFETGPFDPEGLLNWLMVAATAHFGYCSALLTIGTDVRDVSMAIHRHLKHVVGAGAALIAAGLLVQSSAGVPINKNLWSLPFVLVCSGLASIALALVVAIVAASESKRSTTRQLVWMYASYPWAFVGTNSVAIYAMHEICQRYAPFSPRSMDGGGEQVSRLELVLFNLVGVAWWIFVAGWLHHRGVFIKL